MVRALWTFLTRWYVSAVLLTLLGVVGGFLVFYNIFPRKPEIGIIDVPSTRLDNESVGFIGDMLNYAVQNPSIKAVVIKLDSPGGEISASDQLYLKILRLREKKPVVIAVGSTAASGGYQMLLGANYTYVKPTSFIGGIGAILDLQPQSRPNESRIVTGPDKLTGGSDRDFVRAVSLMSENFLQTVISQRGDKLQMSRQELAEGRLYLGLEAVEFGLVDAIGTDMDAIERAADLASIAHYELVDINEMVLRECNRKVRRILDASEEENSQMRLPGLSCSKMLFPS